MKRRERQQRAACIEIKELVRKKGERVKKTRKNKGDRIELQIKVYLFISNLYYTH